MDLGLSSPSRLLTLARAIELTNPVPVEGETKSWD